MYLPPQYNVYINNAIHKPVYNPTAQKGTLLYNQTFQTLLFLTGEQQSSAGREECIASLTNFALSPLPFSSVRQKEMCALRSDCNFMKEKQ